MNTNETLMSLGGVALFAGLWVRSVSEVHKLRDSVKFFSIRHEGMVVSINDLTRRERMALAASSEARKQLYRMGSRIRKGLVWDKAGRGIAQIKRPFLLQVTEGGDFGQIWSLSTMINAGRSSFASPLQITASASDPAAAVELFRKRLADYETSQAAEYDSELEETEASEEAEAEKFAKEVRENAAAERELMNLGLLSDENEVAP